MTQEGPLLSAVNTVLVLPSEPFRVVERFVVGNKKDDPVPIFQLWKKFDETFDLEVEAAPERTLKIYTLLRPAYDSRLIGELGGHFETNFSDLWALLKRHRADASTPLQENGKGNLFYIRDKRRKLWVVGAHWYFNQGWVIAFSYLGVFPHDAGSRVISR